MKMAFGICCRRLVYCTPYEVSETPPIRLGGRDRKCAASERPIAEGRDHRASKAGRCSAPTARDYYLCLRLWRIVYNADGYAARPPFSFAGLGRPTGRRRRDTSRRGLPTSVHNEAGTWHFQRPHHISRHMLMELFDCAIPAVY